MNKPNYRLGIGSENGIAKIIRTTQLKKYTPCIEERTFCLPHPKEECSSVSPGPDISCGCECDPYDLFENERGDFPEDYCPEYKIPSPEPNNKDPVENPLDQCLCAYDLTQK